MTVIINRHPHPVAFDLVTESVLSFTVKIALLNAISCCYADQREMLVTTCQVACVSLFHLLRRALLQPQCDATQQPEVTLQ